MNILNEGYNSSKNLFKSGKGPHIKGINNKNYLDLSCGSGTILLGHNNQIFKNICISVENVSDSRDISFYVNGHNLLSSIIQLSTVNTPATLS